MDRELSRLDAGNKPCGRAQHQTHQRLTGQSGRGAPSSCAPRLRPYLPAKIAAFLGSSGRASPEVPMLHKALSPSGAPRCPERQRLAEAQHLSRNTDEGFRCRAAARTRACEIERPGWHRSSTARGNTVTFHVTWSDSRTNYVAVEGVQEMGDTLDAIANKFDGLVLVSIDYEDHAPATQLRVLVGHPTRSAIRWTEYTDPVHRHDGSDGLLHPFDGPLACDDDGEAGELLPSRTRISPDGVRRAVLDFVATDGGRPRNVPLWTPITRTNPN